MFDVSFSELLIIGIVALIVIGPERLPAVARTLGHLLGRLQRYVSDVKSDLRREIQLDELKKIQTEVAEQARSIERTVVSEMQSVESSLTKPAESLAEVMAETGHKVAAVGESTLIDFDPKDLPPPAIPPAVAPAPAVASAAAPTPPGRVEANGAVPPVAAAPATDRGGART